MKVILLIMVFLLLITGCHNDVNVQETDSNEQETMVSESPNDNTAFNSTTTPFSTDSNPFESTSANITRKDPVYQLKEYNHYLTLPIVEVSDYNISKYLTYIKPNNLSVNEFLYDSYYCSESVPMGQGYNQSGSKYCFYTPTNDNIYPLIIPNGTPMWTYGASSQITLKGRYQYKWLSVTGQFSAENYQDVKLFRIDGKTKKLEIIDSLKLVSPFVLLTKLNDEEFVSYYNIDVESKDADNAVLTVATIYNINGQKKEIIREKFENNKKWDNSKGIILENFSCLNNEIYAIGRQKISNEDCYFIFHYDKNGKLLNKEQIWGLNKYFSNSAFIEFHIVDDYLLFFDSDLCNYIFKLNGNTATLIAKIHGGNWAYSDKYIYFMATNVDMETAEIISEPQPLHIIDLKSNTIYAVKITLPNSKKINFSQLLCFSDSSIGIKYNDTSVTGSFKYDQYILKERYIDEFIREQESLS